jgi:hypothetical protein
MIYMQHRSFTVPPMSINSFTVGLTGPKYIIILKEQTTKEKVSK